MTEERGRFIVQFVKKVWTIIPCSAIFASVVVLEVNGSRKINLNVKITQIRLQTQWKCPNIKLNGRSLQVMKRFSYLGDKTRDSRGGARIAFSKNDEWSPLRDLLPVLTSRGFPEEQT